MNAAWDSAEPRVKHAIGPLFWLVVVVRTLALAVLVFGGLALLMLLRLIERPLHEENRPMTPYITQAVCKASFWIMGLQREVIGQPMRHRGAVVANHSSWLDIFALNAAQRIYFVSKSEVENWPGIGWLARATGTVFIERDRKRAQDQTRIFQQRLLHGHRLLFFPEGTSTDGLQVIPFKTTLFEAFLAPELKSEIWIQPVTVNYTSPLALDPRFYGWWGDMTFGAHLLVTLSVLRQGRVTTVYHSPLRVSDYENRKALGMACEEQVRRGHRVTLPD